MNRHAVSTRRVRPLQILAGVVAMSFVFGPGIAGLLGVREKPIENRALSPAPSLDQGFKAFDAVTPWAVDRLPGRSKAVELKGLMDYYGYGDLPGTQVAQPLGVAGAGGAAAPSKPGGLDGSSLTPKVIRGKDGYLFYGMDFTSACGGESRFEKRVEGLRDFAHIVEKSGREVVFTIAPNKSSVARDKIGRAVPRGDCARAAIADEIDVIDGLKDPLWIPVRAELEALHLSGKDAYWHTDTHWTTLGASLWVRSFMERLDPELAADLEFSPSSQTMLGEMVSLIGLDFTETISGVRTVSNAKVTEIRLPGYDPAKRTMQTTAWTTSGPGPLLKGQTLFVGDSFTSRAMPLVKPLIADGTFTWIGSTPDQDIVDYLKKSDTVVIEVVQRNLVTDLALLSKKSFQRKVAKALGVTP